MKANRIGKNLDRIEIKSKSQLREWLAKNHTSHKSYWLISYKKSHTDYHVSWGDLVDQLLCFGWIDSVINKVDEHRTMRLISKRKKGSIWSLVNKNKVSQLIKEGQMTADGLEVIEQAKKDGSWNFLDEIDQLIIPNDLMSELKLYPNALSYFEEFPKSIKRGILYWIKSARKPETRENRIIETALLASENVRANSN